MKSLDIIKGKTNSELVVLYDEYVEFGNSGILGEETMLRKTIRGVSQFYGGSFTEWMLPTQIMVLDEIARRTINELKNKK